MKFLELLVVGCLAAATLTCGDETSEAISRAGPAPTPRGGTARVEFRADPDPPTAASGILTYINGSDGASIGPGLPENRYEAIFFEFEAGRAGGWVGYVDKAEVVACGSGLPVPLEGGAFLKVHFDGATQHGATNPEYLPLKISGSGAPILEAKQICDFEGVVEWVIGLPAVQDFEVEVLDKTLRRVEVRLPRQSR